MLGNLSFPLKLLNPAQNYLQGMKSFVVMYCISIPHTYVYIHTAHLQLYGKYSTLFIFDPSQYLFRYNISVLKHDANPCYYRWCKHVALYYCSYTVNMQICTCIFHYFLQKQLMQLL